MQLMADVKEIEKSNLLQKPFQYLKTGNQVKDAEMQPLLSANVVHNLFTTIPQFYKFAGTQNYV